eukprot:309194-Pleurochrysis_carterae.AAC.1
MRSAPLRRNTMRRRARTCNEMAISLHSLSHIHARAYIYSRTWMSHSVRALRLTFAKLTASSLYHHSHLLRLSQRLPELPLLPCSATLCSPVSAPPPHML